MLRSSRGKETFILLLSLFSCQGVALKFQNIGKIQYTINKFQLNPINVDDRFV